MCGIAGIVGLGNGARPVTVDELSSMHQSLQHRGPDAHGVQLIDSLGGFAHARLSIIDLDPQSNQPLENDDGSLVIVYNGEVYNYVELRSELVKLGRTFRTKSDTEVVLKAYEQWGTDCVQKLNGMWAFAIYDQSRQSVFCSRDRFGIKPFVYGTYDDRLYFASEAKAILAVEDAFRRPNHDALSLLLRSSISGYNEQTCFVGILRLPPAHNMLIHDGQLKIWRYWDYPELRDDRVSFADACDGFRELLSDSIRIRLRSDVPLGLTLSGGLDSSAIACLTRKCSDSRLNTYTASYDAHDQWDESQRAESLARQLAFQSHRVSLTQADFTGNVIRAIDHLETPHHSIAILPYMNIVRRAKEDVTVLLEGQGADELLGGYVSITTASALADDFRNLRLSSAAKRMAQGLSGRLGFSGKRFVMELVRSAIPGLHDGYRRWRGDEAVYQAELAQGPSRIPLGKNRQQNQDCVNRNLMQQHQRGLLNLLLYGDAISMAFSVESRLPFMDYRLVEYCFSLPGHFKLRNGLGKALLRESTRSIVPNHILDDKRKIGFVAPVAEWLREDPSFAIDVLGSQVCRERGLFDTVQIRRLIDQHASGQANLFSNIYRWIMTELWFQHFIDRTHVPAGAHVN